MPLGGIADLKLNDVEIQSKMYLNGNLLLP